MIVAAVLIAWVVVGLMSIVGMGAVMVSWNRIADAVHKSDPRLRDAIGWPHRNLALVHVVWPVEGFLMWRVQMRTSLYGLPDTPRIAAETRAEARRYRRLIWLFSTPFILPGLVLGWAAVEFLIFLLCIPLVLTVIAGRWPSKEEIEQHMTA